MRVPIVDLTRTFSSEKNDFLFIEIYKGAINLRIKFYSVSDDMDLAEGM